MEQRNPKNTVRPIQNKQLVPFVSKSAKRKARRNKNKGNYVTSNVSSVQPRGVSTGAKSQGQYNSIIKDAVRAVMPKITPAGLAFLKCAFAPPDFSASNVAGVPDDFQGRSLVKKHRLVTSQGFTSANTDYYFLVLPTPGYAYWTASVPAGTPILQSTVFTGQPYADCAALFNSGGTAGLSSADIFDKFRLISNHFEIVPTSNQMIWTGNVQAWKFPSAVFVRQNNASTGEEASNILSISGLQSCNATNADQYIGPFNLGVYTVTYNTGAKFDFNAIMEFVTSIPSFPFISIGEIGQISAPVNGIPGFDNQFDSLVVKVSGMGSNVSNTAIIKSWSCVEYQVLPGTGYYEFQNFSPSDPLALDLYRKIVNQLPVGVSFVDNESFWQRVLQIIRTLSGGLSVLPGPYGAAAKGTNMIAGALEEIVF